MEFSPKVFRDVQFREKLRGGYHPEDVDEFLEQAAVAVEAMQEQLRQATERAQRAEQISADASATDEALKRMLLMAQRTADQAVHEARDEADRLLADARAQAGSILADAEERGRRAYESGLAEGRANMEKLEDELRTAHKEVEAIRGWVDLHKAHLLSVLSEAQSLVQDAGLLSEPPVPAPSSSPPAHPVTAGAPTAQLLADGAPLGPTEDISGGAAEMASNFEREGLGSSERDWDPSYLDNLARPDGARPSLPTPPGDGEAGESSSPTLGSREPVLGDAAPARRVEADPALALDERAMDSFFSDQDLGDDRGPGRFRRRQ